MPCKSRNYYFNRGVMCEARSSMSEDWNLRSKVRSAKTEVLVEVRGTKVRCLDSRLGIRNYKFEVQCPEVQNMRPVGFNIEPRTSSIMPRREGEEVANSGTEVWRNLSGYFRAASKCGIESFRGRS
jgi:hypothetical protein